MLFVALACRAVRDGRLLRNPGKRKNRKETDAAMIEKTKTQKRYETAICFARMYGVKETLEPLPYVENEIITGRMLQWAEEYLESGSADMVQFFLDKCKDGLTEGGGEGQ